MPVLNKHFDFTRLYSEYLDYSPDFESIHGRIFDSFGQNYIVEKKKDAMILNPTKWVNIAVVEMSLADIAWG